MRKVVQVQHFLRMARGGGGQCGVVGQAAARFCLSLVAAMQGDNVVEYTYVQTDDSDDAAFFSHPVRLGPNGVEEILSYGELSAFEQKAKEDMLEGLRGDIKLGVDFVNG